MKPRCLDDTKDRRQACTPLHSEGQSWEALIPCNARDGTVCNITTITWNSKHSFWRYEILGRQTNMFLSKCKIMPFKGFKKVKLNHTDETKTPAASSWYVSRLLRIVEAVTAPGYSTRVKPPTQREAVQRDANERMKECKTSRNLSRISRLHHRLSRCGNR